MNEQPARLTPFATHWGTYWAEVRDGRIWGRGTCDTKGTGAAMLWALRQYAQGEIERAAARTAGGRWTGLRRMHFRTSPPAVGRRARRARRAGPVYGRALKAVKRAAGPRCPRFQADFWASSDFRYHEAAHEPPVPARSLSA